MIDQMDIAVVGAGPAGLSAAIEAARAGASVAVIDESASIGGQIFRQVPAEFAVTEPAQLGRDHRRGQALFRELEGLTIRFMLRTLAWGSFEDRTLELVNDKGSSQLSAKVLVFATGAYDRPVPLPGWTLPGVVTAGGAQTLLKSQRILPGRRVLMAGTGPLQLVVASQLAKAGAELVAVVDPVPTRHVLARPAALLRGWRITRDGIAYRWHLLKARVPWVAPALLVRIDGTTSVERATIARVNGDWRPLAGTEQTFVVDTVCLGYGLVPSVGLLRLLDCRVEYNALVDSWEPVRDERFETTRSGVFAVGDGAGVAGALVAADEGRVAGIAAAQLTGHLTESEARVRMTAPRRRLSGREAFRAAMDRIYRLRPGLFELATPDTLVCRCEEITLRELKQVLAEGATSVRQTRNWSRLGMGACQGRMCGLNSARLLAAHLGVDIAQVGCNTPRPPLKPTPIAKLLQETAVS